MSTALYRRYRPDTFDEVIGQEHVVEPLMRALDNNRVNHAYLFSGPRGCGKTTSARILARCLNCAEGPTGTPCGRCESCVDLATGGPGSLDVVEIDAASHNGVDDARDLRERAVYAPARDRYKIFILDEAHMVTTQGFNALLKLVEEPPEHVKFVFATTEPDKVIGTIRSRTHHYPFRLVPPERLRSYLAELCEREGVEVAKGVLPLVVRAGGGSVRDTLSVLDQLMAGAGPEGMSYERAIALLGYTHATLLDDIVEGFGAADGAAVYRVVDRVIESGHDPRRFVEDLLERLRDLIVIHAAPDSAQAILPGVPADQLERMSLQAQSLGAAELSRAADVLNAGLSEMTGATSPRLQLELICARVLLPGIESTSQSIQSRIDRLERRVGAGGAVPTARGDAGRGDASGGHAVRGDSPRGDSARGGSAERAPIRDSAGADSPRGDSGRGDIARGDSGRGDAAPSAQRPAAPGSRQAAPGEQAAGAAVRQGAPSAEGSPAAASAAAAPAQSRGGDSGRGGDTAYGSNAPGAPGSGSASPEKRAPEPQVADSDSRATARGSQADDSELRAAAPDRPAADGRAPSTGGNAGSTGADARATRGNAEPDRNAEPDSREARPTSQDAQPAGQEPEAGVPGSAPAGSGSDGSTPAGSAPAASGDLDAIRRSWPQIVEALSKGSKLTWALVSQNATVLAFDGSTLTLGFPTEPLANRFNGGQNPGRVAEALGEELGIQAAVAAVVGKDPSVGQGSGGPGNGGGQSGKGPGPSGQGRAGGSARGERRDAGLQAPPEERSVDPWQPAEPADDSDGNPWYTPEEEWARDAAVEATPLPADAGAPHGDAGSGGTGEGDAPHGGARARGTREGGARENDARESGARESGARESGARESGARESGAHEGAAAPVTPDDPAANGSRASDVSDDPSRHSAADPSGAGATRTQADPSRHSAADSSRAESTVPSADPFRNPAQEPNRAAVTGTPGGSSRPSAPEPSRTGATDAFGARSREADDLGHGGVADAPDGATGAAPGHDGSGAPDTSAGPSPYADRDDAGAPYAGQEAPGVSDWLNAPAPAVPAPGDMDDLPVEDDTDDASAPTGEVEPRGAGAQEPGTDEAWAQNPGTRSAGNQGSGAQAAGAQNAGTQHSGAPGRGAQAASSSAPVAEPDDENFIGAYADLDISFTSNPGYEPPAPRSAAGREASPRRAPGQSGRRPSRGTPRDDGPAVAEPDAESDARRDAPAATGRSGPEGGHDAGSAAPRGGGAQAVAGGAMPAGTVPGGSLPDTTVVYADASATPDWAALQRIAEGGRPGGGAGGTAAGGAAASSAGGAAQPDEASFDAMSEISDDDEDQAGSTLVGRAVVESILGGVVIEEKNE